MPKRRQPAKCKRAVQNPGWFLNIDGSPAQMPSKMLKVMGATLGLTSKEMNGQKVDQLRGTVITALKGAKKKKDREWKRTMNHIQKMDSDSMRRFIHGNSRFRFTSKIEQCLQEAGADVIDLCTAALERKDYVAFGLNTAECMRFEDFVDRMYKCDLEYSVDDILNDATLCTEEQKEEKSDVSEPDVDAHTQNENPKSSASAKGDEDHAEVYKMVCGHKIVKGSDEWKVMRDCANITLGFKMTDAEKKRCGEVYHSNLVPNSILTQRLNNNKKGKMRLCGAALSLCVTEILYGDLLFVEYIEGNKMKETNALLKGEEYEEEQEEERNTRKRKGGHNVFALQFIPPHETMLAPDASDEANKDILECNEFWELDVISFYLDRWPDQLQMGIDAGLLKSSDVGRRAVDGNKLLSKAEERKKRLQMMRR